MADVQFAIDRLKALQGQLRVLEQSEATTLLPDEEGTAELSEQLAKLAAISETISMELNKNRHAGSHGQIERPIVAADEEAQHAVGSRGRTAWQSKPHFEGDHLAVASTQRRDVRSCKGDSFSVHEAGQVDELSLTLSKLQAIDQSLSQLSANCPIQASSSDSLMKLNQLSSRLDQSLVVIEGSLIDQELQDRLRDLQALDASLDAANGTVVGREEDDELKRKLLALQHMDDRLSSSTHIIACATASTNDAEHTYDGDAELRRSLQLLTALDSQLEHLHTLPMEPAYPGEQHAERPPAPTPDRMHRLDELRMTHHVASGIENGDSARALHQRIDSWLAEDEANLPLLHQLFDSVFQLDDFSDRIKVLRAAEKEACARAGLQGPSAVSQFIRYANDESDDNSPEYDGSGIKPDYDYDVDVDEVELAEGELIASAEMDEKEGSAISELRKVLEQLGLPVEGPRKVLLERLTDHLLSSAGTAEWPELATESEVSVVEGAREQSARSTREGAALQVEVPPFADADEDEPVVDRTAELPPRPKTSRGGPGRDPFHYVSPSPTRDSTAQTLAVHTGDGTETSRRLEGKRTRLAFEPASAARTENRAEKNTSGSVSEAPIDPMHVNWLEASARMSGDVVKGPTEAGASGSETSSMTENSATRQIRNSSNTSSDWSCCSYDDVALGDDPELVARRRQYRARLTGIWNAPADTRVAADSTFRDTLEGDVHRDVGAITIDDLPSSELTLSGVLHLSADARQRWEVLRNEEQASLAGRTKFVLGTESELEGEHFDILDPQAYASLTTTGEQVSDAMLSESRSSWEEVMAKVEAVHD
ncbi:hypothetical protein AB1Y20_012721 [Prymnesium parvum]|uniref:SAP domain-containing protein n=1 Tax=Prymnesium parvum TaxID=97485 RepID=A0AB34IIP7_PRYPA